MKTRWAVIVVFVLSLILVSCGSDGKAYVSIAYQTETGKEYIVIEDDYSSNGVYADKQNSQFYCQNGMDTVVKIPAQTLWRGVQDSSPAIILRAEAVCQMGQARFDEFLQLFQLVQEP